MSLEYEEREAARFALLPFPEYRRLPVQDRVDIVAHFRLAQISKAVMEEEAGA